MDILVLLIVAGLISAFGIYIGSQPTVPPKKNNDHEPEA